MGKSDDPYPSDNPVYAETLLEMTPNLVVFLDTDNHVQKMSKAARLMFGIADSASCDGVSIFDIVKNQVLVLLIRKWFEKLNKGLPVDETFPLDRLGTNQYEWFQVKASRVEHGGRIVGKVFFITDVSLLYSQKKILDTLLVSSPADIFVFDRNLQILVVSDSVARANGFYSWRDLAGRNLRELPKLDIPFVEKILDTAILDDEPVHQVVKHKDPRGDIRWLYVDVRTIKSTAGVFGYIMTRFDITREIKPKAILDALMESTSDAIAIVNPEGIVEYASQPLVTNLGFHDWRTVINKPWSFLFRNAGPDQSKFAELFAGETTGSRQGTISVGTGDSSQFYLIAIASNSTELVQARERAEAAVRAKAAFLANMSHELRTPMNAVLGMNELLSRTTLNSLQKNYSEHIRSSATMLLSIINDILDFSRIEDRKLELSEAVYSVSSTLHDVINLVAVKVSEKELSFTADIDPTLPSRLIGDELRVKQILVNLLNNAVKFTESGEVNLAVTAVRSSDGQSVWINYRVRDTGPGIPKARQAELFGRFNRIESDSNKGIEGSGLGLAICKGLVTLMKGSLTLESEEGAGSTFTAGFAQRIASGAEPLAVFRLASSVRLLVFDTDPYTVASIRQMAGYGKFEVDFCSDPDDFTARLMNNRDRRAGAGWTHVIFEYKSGYDRAMVNVSSHPGTRWLALLSMTDFIGKGKDPAIDFTFKPLVVSTFARFIQGDRVDFSESLPLVNSMGIQPIYFRATGVSVLVVDDSAVNRKVAEGFLQTLDVRCDEAESGLDAVQKASRYRYDLILMDHLMPGMDGLEATAKLREIPGYREVPIIALTANAGSAYEQMYRKAGMNDTIYKPIEFNAFVRCLKKWLPPMKIEVYGRPAAQSGTGAVSESAAEGPMVGSQKNASHLLIGEREMEPRAAASVAGALGGAGKSEAERSGEQPKGGWIPGLDRDTGIGYTGSLQNLEMILKVFKRTGPKMLDQLESGRKSGSLTQFRTAVHALISSGANIGALELSSCARDLEQAIIAGKTEDIDRLYPDLHGQLEGLISSVSAHFDNQG